MPPSFLRNRPVLAFATSHWLCLVGVGLLVTGMVTWLILLPVRLRTGEDNPYIGLGMVVVVPAVLTLGALLTVLGAWLGRRRVREHVAANVDAPNVALRRLLLFVAITAVVNLLIGTQFTYRAVHFMESRDFCGSCHVMHPESTAFAPGPHSGLLCVDCHVGSGAAGFVAAKLQGTKQLWHVLTDTVPKPIAGAIESGRMVASEETCERCHDREKLASVRLKVFRTYEPDEANTPKTTVLTMHVGGARMGGIHGAHCGPGVAIRFVANDGKRQDIPLVEYTNALSGERRVYVRDGATAEQFAGSGRIDMQCIDCHNRAAHVFHGPEQAIDLALTLGDISSSLPFVKQQGLAILKAEYASTAAAQQQIPQALAAWYRAERPEVLAQREADVAAAGAALARLWARNVHPELGVDWDTYPDNRGHGTFPGCFRCHQGEHRTATGETITKNCFKCHGASAVNEADPEILKTLDLRRPIDAMRAK